MESRAGIGQVFHSKADAVGATDETSPQELMQTCNGYLHEVINEANQ